MTSVRNDALNVALDTSDNPYLLGGYAPVDTEITAQDLEVIGEIPDDLNGLYVRNGPNPQHAPTDGRYHWFDGDGMLHGIHFREGTATYRNRWVRTLGFRRETEAGHPLYAGMMEDTSHNPNGGRYFRNLKDTSNTDVVFHNGNLLTMWYLAGEAYKIDPYTLETIGTEDWGGAHNGCVSAHAKVDERTGEFLFFDYGPRPPFMSYGVVSADGVLKHMVPIDLPGARMPHDMWITEHYSILMDLPLYADPEVSAAGRHKLIFNRDLPSRFAVLPRYGDPSDVRWFEAEPCYVYHTINAWEEGDELVLDFCRTRRPKPPSRPLTGPLESVLEYLRLDAQYYRYRFNMVTGAVTEGPLDEVNTEFPMINTQFLGRKSPLCLQRGNRERLHPEVRRAHQIRRHDRGLHQVRVRSGPIWQRGAVRSTAEWQDRGRRLPGLLRVRRQHRPLRSGGPGCGHDERSVPGCHTPTGPSRLPRLLGARGGSART